MARKTALSNDLTHVDRNGRMRMVDVSTKPPMLRIARAEGEIRMAPSTIRKISGHALPKGDVLACARVAGILAAKNTANLIPLCHPLPLSHASVEFRLKRDRVRITASATTVAGTGVEMEALVAVSVAALTLYDMCKAVDKKMALSNMHLVSKTKEPFL